MQPIITSSPIFDSNQNNIIDMKSLGGIWYLKDMRNQVMTFLTGTNLFKIIRVSKMVQNAITDPSTNWIWEQNYNRAFLISAAPAIFNYYQAYKKRIQRLGIASVATNKTKQPNPESVKKAEIDLENQRKLAQQSNDHLKMISILEQKCGLSTKHFNCIVDRSILAHYCAWNINQVHDAEGAIIHASECLRRYDKIPKPIFFKCIDALYTAFRSQRRYNAAESIMWNNGDTAFQNPIVERFLEYYKAGHWLKAWFTCTRSFNVYHSTNMIDLIHDAIEKQLKANPNDFVLRAALAHFSVGPGREIHLETALKGAPSNPIVHVLISDFYLRSSIHFDKVIKHISKAKELAPNDIHIAVFIAISCALAIRIIEIRREDPIVKKANIQRLKDEISLNLSKIEKRGIDRDNSIPYDLLSATFGTYDKLELEYQCLQKLLEMHPYDHSAQLLFASHMFRVQNHSKAFDHIHKAHQLSPFNAQVFISEGDFYKLTEQLEKAKNCFVKAIILAEQDEGTRFKAQISLGTIYIKMKNWDQAFDLYKEMESSGVLISEVFAGKAICYAAKGNTEQAKREWEYALALEMRNKEFMESVRMDLVHEWTRKILDMSNGDIQKLVSAWKEYKDKYESLEFDNSGKYLVSIPHLIAAIGEELYKLGAHDKAKEALRYYSTLDTKEFRRNDLIALLPQGV